MIHGKRVFVLTTTVSLLVLMLNLRLPSLARLLSTSSSTTRTMSTTGASSYREARLRKWHARMSDDHGWLRTFLTFSFAGHYDPAWTSFGPLRVVNEDRIQPQTGFPTHSHQAYEIFSYVLDGELSHKDSMGNIETLKRGEVQYTRAGTGIRHSEWNDQKDKDTHFMQVRKRGRSLQLCLNRANVIFTNSPRSLPDLVQTRCG